MQPPIGDTKRSLNKSFFVGFRLISITTHVKRGCFSLSYVPKSRLRVIGRNASDESGRFSY